MTSNVNLIAFGTFGSPNGFRQSFFSGNKEIEKSIRTFDLNSNAIKVVSNSKLYSIRKEINNHVKGISYSLYTYAKEQNSERGGTFIGSSLLFTNEICKEGLTVSILNDFHDKILVKNVHDNIIIVNHSDKLSVSKPKDFDKIEFDLRPIEFLDSTFNQNNYLVVYTELKIEKLQVLFNKALTLLGNYSTIYFTDNNEIAEFVYQKGLYKLLKVDGFDQEIANIEYEKQQKILNSISEFEQEKQKLQTDKDNVLAEIRNQLDRLKNTHSENERILKESESKISNINSYYIEFSKKLDDYSNQLKSGRKLEDVRKLYSENKRIFIDSVSNSKQPQFINKLNKINATSNLKQDYNRPQYNQSYSQSSQFNNEEAINRHRSKSNKFSIYKILTAVFCLLWLGTIAYFLVFNKQNEKEIMPITEQEYPQQQNIPQPVEVKQPELNPNPNSKLNSNDLKLLNKEGIKNKTPKQILEIVFLKNPTDIASHYNNQKELYEKLLISQNANCFQDNICICDSLLIIPSYKK